MRIEGEYGTPGMGNDGVEPEGFTAAILCGGIGSRLQRAVSGRPKALALVGDEPFVLRLLDQLASAGCDRVVFCTGYLAEQIERTCGCEHDGMELVYSQEAAPLGTAGALRAAMDRFGEDPDESWLVMNGDSYTDVEIADFVLWAREGDCPALIVAGVQDAERFGTVTFDADCDVQSFHEKRPGSGAGQINTGIYWLPWAVLAELQPGPASLEREVLPDLVGQGLQAYASTGAFLDIGTPESYAAASGFFADLALAASKARSQHRGLLVVDRDGTLIEERHYLADPEMVRLLPGVVEGLTAFAAAGYELVIVTNQSGIGRGYFDEATANAVNAEVLQRLADSGITVRAIYMCPHRPEAACSCRKPAPGMLQQAMDELGFVPNECLVVGDKQCDIDLGARVGARTALVRTGYGRGTERDGYCAPDLVVDHLGELATIALGAAVAKGAAEVAL